MLSIIITAYKEEKHIGKVLHNILNTSYSQLGLTEIDKYWEIIVIAPDQETRNAAKLALEELNVPQDKQQILQDEQRGKPAALNICFKAAKGDWLLLTDGDVFLDKAAVGEIIKLAANDKTKKLGGVTGRPVSSEPLENMLDYWGHLLADAAHHKRNIDLTEHPVGKSTKFLPKRKFFPLSGYLMLVKNIGWELPTDVLADDAYISYELYNKGYKLGYAPESRVMVKYADSLDDYFKQKKRSTGGYVQLWSYGVVKQETKSRSFWRELEYFWFPLKYARSIKQLWWSLLLYPARLCLWLMIYWERKISPKDFESTWVRIESTK